MSGELARWENESSPERREEQIGTKLIEQKYQMLDKTRDMEMGVKGQVNSPPPGPR
jgi:hypothetical protein